MTKTITKTSEGLIKNSVLLGAYLLVVWGFYRFLFQLPVEIEELLIKPIIWLVPVYFLVKKEKVGLASLGFTVKNFFPAIYLSLGLGILFAGGALFVNYLKYQGFDFNANIGSKFILFSLIISLVTAITEEATFRGYMFSRIWSATGNELLANLSTSFIWSVVHLPVTIFVWKLSFTATLVYLLLTLLFGIGAAFIYAKTKNITAAILLHVLWSWPIILFR